MNIPRYHALALILMVFAAAIQAKELPKRHSPPTFSVDIAPIIYKNCTSCHRDGEIAPFPLVSYNDVAKRADLITAVTGSHYMPPWKPVKNYVTHADARGLTDQEIAIIQEWAGLGAPQGDSTMTPPVPEYPKGSQLGTPDLVLKMSEPYLHKGTGKDMYRCFVIPTGLLQDRDVSAIEFRPGNNKIVHHALLFLDTTGTGRKKDSADPDGGYLGFGGPGFTEAVQYMPWVPGQVVRPYPDGIASKMYKNSDLVIQIHYAPTTVDQSDQSSVNVFFSKTPVIRPAIIFAQSPANLTNGPFRIPANQKKSFEARYTVPLDVSLLTIAPHMHLLGRDARAYAITPTGDTLRQIWIDDWNFQWQGGYTFKKIQKIPKGSILVYETSYDNTTGNYKNPNSPPKLTTWGESTYDEMILCYYFFTIYLPGDENIVLETKPQSTVPTGDQAARAALGLTCEPNPASTHSVIRFTLAKPSVVTLALYDEAGNLVKTFIDRARTEPGLYSLPCDAAQIFSGTYFIRLTTGDLTTSAVLKILNQ